jgi:hypothetical protein
LGPGFFYKGIYLIQKRTYFWMNAMDDANSEPKQKERVLALDELISASLTPVGTSEEILGFVVDTSAHGFQISIPKAIPPDTIVELTITRQADDDVWEINKFLAKVRRCDPDELLEESFNIGIKVLEITSGT